MKESGRIWNDLKGENSWESERIGKNPKESEGTCENLSEFWGISGI